MILGGYRKDIENFVELKEVSIVCNMDELDKIINFLLHVKEQHNAVKEKTSTCHSHYRDWSDVWREGDSDLIIISNFTDM